MVLGTKYLKSRNLSQELYQIYFLEMFMSCCYTSKYKDNIIFNGDLILSFILKKKLNYCNELSFVMNGIAVNKFNISRILKEIVTNMELVKVNSFDITLVKNGKKRKYRVAVNYAINEIDARVWFNICESNGLFPMGNLENYEGYFIKSMINMYNLDEVIVEKMIEIFVYNKINMKYFYDLYLIVTNKVINGINLSGTLKNALILENGYKFGECEQFLASLKGNKLLNIKWKTFLINKGLDSSVTIDEILIMLEFLVKLVKNNK